MERWKILGQTNSACRHPLQMGVQRQCLHDDYMPIWAVRPTEADPHKRSGGCAQAQRVPWISEAEAVPKRSGSRGQAQRVLCISEAEAVPKRSGCSARAQRVLWIGARAPGSGRGGVGPR